MKLSLENIQLPTEINPCASFDREAKEFTEAEVIAPIFERDGNIYCKAVDEEGSFFADYYGEFRGNLPWVSEKLETWAKENFGEGAYWEWENPEELCLAI